MHSHSGRIFADAHARNHTIALPVSCPMAPVHPQPRPHIIRQKATLLLYIHTKALLTV